MSELRENQERAKALRAAVRDADKTLYTRQNRLRSKRRQLEDVERQGEAGVESARVLRRELRALEGELEKDRSALSAARDELAGVLADFPLLDQPWDLVEALDDGLPFLLLPVRIETRFMTVEEGRRELWVRIFPDEIAVFTHEKTLTAGEVKAGETYWREIWSASQAEEEGERETVEKGAWRALAGTYGGARAAWIAGQTAPATLDVASPDDLEFPAFDPETLKQESWSRAPRTTIMPDRFVVAGYLEGEEVIREAGNSVAHPLFLGPDPEKLEDEYIQENGELLVGEDIAWIYDFDKAVQAGMGLRIALDEPLASRGLDRLLVLGLWLSSDEQESQAMVEDLFENHRFSPDGMSLLPQGTPTNNTDSARSGFSSVDPGAETSYEVETGEPLFQPTDEHFEIRDGQRLAEGLGISYASLQRLQHADRQDVVEATWMNKALWHGTLGYYLEEMLEVDLTTIGLIREFFVENVTGRGPLPAIRVGTQPYGVLVTSDLSSWKWSRELDGDRFRFLESLQRILNQADAIWHQLLDEVARVGAPGDPYENLLSMIGLHASSVEFHRRRALGRGYIYNYAAFRGSAVGGDRLMDVLRQQALELVQELGLEFEALPQLFELPFLSNHDQLSGPIVDDIPADESEKLSELIELKKVYSAPDPADLEAEMLTNYIGWLAHSLYDDVKAQRFRDADGESLPVPRPLLYRMLRNALLQAKYDATMQLYHSLELLPVAARREVELGNIQEERTVTRWEFMDADVSRVMPALSQESMSVGRYLQSNEGLSHPEALDLRDVRECLQALSGVPTARLERLFVEHVDLCSYRLDAWQTGFFNRRLRQQRFPAEGEEASESRVQGLYLGAFGWVEDLRPAPELTAIESESVPLALHDPEQDGALFEQPNNAGFIHGPSLNHAATAAVLRNAYITHFDPNEPEKMAVNLSSERVRTALGFLEGIRNGQALGALLGYQFERGLNDRHGDQSLNQYLPFFRDKYPLLADKITPGEDGPIEAKEARNVFDGYALLEVTFLKEEGERKTYPYDVVGLPDDPNSIQARAIQGEVARMADSFDAIADLALAEGVYQATQGRFDRAGAMLKAFTEGHNPIEPEIARTPRSGIGLTQRVTLHLQTVAVGDAPWPGTRSQRAKVEPGLNRWLGSLLPLPDKIVYKVAIGDAERELQRLVDLGLQPIDLVYLIGDDLADEVTELERRIAFANVQDPGEDFGIEFMVEPDESEAVTLFELLPLLRSLRELVTGSRPLAADDLMLPSEMTSDPAEDANPKGLKFADLSGRVALAFDAFDQALNQLDGEIPAEDADGERDLNAVDAQELREKLMAMADFGLADAVPLSASGTSNEAKSVLLNQALSISVSAGRSREEISDLMVIGNDTSKTADERLASFREAAQKIFGPAFNLIPVFNLKNPAELSAATGFRDADVASGLTRHHRDNAFIVDEWLQGVAKVREKVGVLESVAILAQALSAESVELKPLQLPFREKDHWISVAYPQAEPGQADDADSFSPEGDYLSIVQHLATGTGTFDPGQAQSGLLIDEWIEVIPRRSETTGIAVHYDQPSTEPPQALLLAVTPEVTGAWTWDKLVGTLNDTLDRARLRAVEPDLLDSTALGHLLPALLSAVTTYPFATISTDFVSQTAALAADNE